MQTPITVNKSTVIPRVDDVQQRSDDTQINTNTEIPSSVSISFPGSSSTLRHHRNDSITEEERRKALYTNHKSRLRGQPVQQQQQSSASDSTSAVTANPIEKDSSTFVVKQEPADIIVVQPDTDAHGPLNQYETHNLPTNIATNNAQYIGETHSLAPGQVGYPSVGREYYQYIGANTRSVYPVQAGSKNASMSKPLDCKVCGKMFSSESSLTKHAGLCQRRRTYSCGYCPKEFFQKYTFRQHVLTHTREKSHQCGECGRKYTQKGDLNRHMYTHLPKKELPFKCDMCDRGFVRKDQLRKHFRSTHSLVGLGASTMVHPPTQAYMTMHPSTHTLP